MVPFIAPVNPVTMETPVSTHVKMVTMALTAVRSVCAKMAHVMEQLDIAVANVDIMGNTVNWAVARVTMATTVSSSVSVEMVKCAIL